MRMDENSRVRLTMGNTAGLQDLATQPLNKACEPSGSHDPSHMIYGHMTCEHRVRDNCIHECKVLRRQDPYNYLPMKD